MMFFNSRRNGWTFFLIICLFTFGCVALWCYKPLPYAQYYGWFFIGLSLLAFWEYATTNYEITGSELIVHTGTAQKRIRLDGIEAVKRQRGIWAWFALSTNQLKISYREGTRVKAIMVYPSNEQGFLGQLKILSPWLQGFE